MESSATAVPWGLVYLLRIPPLQGVKVDHSTPWRQIFSSMAFISLLVVHCAHNWGFWTLLTKIPSYMKTVLEFDIKKVRPETIPKAASVRHPLRFIPCRMRCCPLCPTS